MKTAAGERVPAGGAIRLDQALVERGLAASRERARACILAGQVEVDGQAAVKAGMRVAPDSPITVRMEQPYVGRGGQKLAGALADFELDVAGVVALDGGASTGGFTDCLLQAGARHVIAVDVGYGQLAWRLRQDERVTVVERQNLRYFTPAALAAALPPGLPQPSLATLDLSFIGLGKVLGAVRQLLAPGGLIVALVKPQFEVGRGQVGKRGVVRSPLLHQQALLSVAESGLAEGLAIAGMTFSPLRGPGGNIEYFMLLRMPLAGHTSMDSEPRQLEKIGPDNPDARAALEQDAVRVVRAAWLVLGA